MKQLWLKYRIIAKKPTIRSVVEFKQIGMSTVFQQLKFNGHAWFVLFFFLAVIKPFNYPNINRYIGMGVFVLVAVVFLQTLIQLIGKQRVYQHVWQYYYWEIIAILLFLTVNVWSLSLNLSRFPSRGSLIFYGFASFAVWLLLPMSWLIFHYRQQPRTTWLGWLVIWFLLWVALWQILDKPSSQLLTQYFVAADAPYVINSVTHWYTIYGAMAAIIALVSVTRLLSPVAVESKILWVILLILAIYTGVLGESRNFFFTLWVGLLLLGFRFGLRQPKTVLALLLMMLVAVHVLVIKNAGVAQNYGSALPYLLKLHQNQPLEAKDFIPQWNSGSLSGRDQIWQRGLALWQENRWLGIGAGAFRASSDQTYFNLHNYYLQVLVDAGVLGFLSLGLLLALLMRRCYQAGNILIFISILASLLFDNYLDYSMAWVLVMVWLLKITPLQMTKP